MIASVLSTQLKTQSKNLLKVILYYKIEREENSQFKDKDKEDRYLLLSTNEENSVISKWEDPFEHFLFQLKILTVK